MKRLSIVIITWNQLAYLKACLQSLLPIMKRADVEVIVVDNGSQDGTSQYLTEKFPVIRLLSNSCNKGVAYARNRGLEITTGEKILILDNDTIVNESAISGMEAYLDGHPLVGLCTCKLVDSENRVQESFKPLPGLLFKVRKVLGFSGKNDRVIMDSNVPFEPVYVIGACQMVKREVLQRVGLLDEHIFYGPEDADFCLRIVSEGWKIVYLPQYTIVHHWRRATNRNLFSRLAWKHFCGLCYFYKKYKRIN